jgi:ppGpp synthetase/RelA/SpoT-type nucleotidyltranferase
VNVTEEAETPEEFYESRKGRFEDVCTEVTYALKKELENRGIKYHSVTSRVKTMSSFIEKIGRKSYGDFTTQTTDLAGIRVVCLFMMDLERVNEAISSLFTVVSMEDKVQQGKAETFGYMSHHYICKLSSDHTGPRYNHIQDLVFEVQVRTILMDAWANVSHYLSYKNEDSVPGDLVKDFSALSGLLYVADRQFEALFKASSHSAAQAQEDIAKSSEIPPSEINADTVNALLLRAYPQRKPPSEAGYSTLSAELRNSGYENIGSVAKILAEVEGAAKIVEEEEFVHSEGDEADFNSASFARLSLTIADENFRKIFIAKNTEGASETRVKKVNELIEKMLKIARAAGYPGGS